MSLLSELKSLMDNIGIPIETGVFSKTAPDIYTVLTPLTDQLLLYADNVPEYEEQEVRVSLYSRGNYNTVKNQLTRTFLAAGFSITDRRYLGYESDTGYHHYALDVAKFYIFEED